MLVLVLVLVLVLGRCGLAFFGSFTERWCSLNLYIWKVYVRLVSVRTTDLDFAEKGVTGEVVTFCFGQFGLVMF